MFRRKSTGLHWDAREAGANAEGTWRLRMGQYAEAYPEEERELQRRLRGELPKEWDARVSGLLAKVREKAQSIATRKASQDTIEGLAPILPELIGGSADLAGSNLTLWSSSPADPTRNLGATTSTTACGNLVWRPL